MARINKGILGGVEGRVGDVEGYYLNGVPIIRAKRKPGSRKKISQAQQISMDRMKVVNTFLGSMVSFVKVGFGLTEMGRKSNGYNAAKSYITKNCFDPTDLTFKIDYSKVRLTEGEQPNASDLYATATEGGLEITWATDKNWEYVQNRSQVMLLAYCPSLNMSAYLLSGARKSEGKEFFALPNNFRERDLQVYISFIAEDRKSIATSVYIGVLQFSLIRTE